MSKNIHVVVQIEIPVKDIWKNSQGLSTIVTEATKAARDRVVSCLASTDMRIDPDHKSKVIVVSNDGAI